MQSRGDDGDSANDVAATESTSNCSPIARADAAATRPGEIVLVDVLANDTDADGDQLIFQILTAEGGTAEIDDGDTPTDSADDRLAFTPADPPVETGTVEYQSLDPQGGFGTATLTVAVNPDAALPDGVRSALASDPATESTTESSRCGETVDTTTTTGGVVEQVETTTSLVEADEDDDSTDTTVRRRTTTTRRGSTSGRTTTTQKKSTTNTTSRPTTPTTDAPSVEPGGGSGGPTTTKPTSPPPQPDPDCGTPQSNPNFNQCMRDKYSSPPTSAAP